MWAALSRPLGAAGAAAGAGGGRGPDHRGDPEASCLAERTQVSETHRSKGGTEVLRPTESTRLRLLEFILRGERTSAECVEHAGVSQPRVSVHLSCLVDCGYVTARRDGKKLRYSVGDPRVADLVVLARSLAADNAAALTCCTRIPDHEG